MQKAFLLFPIKADLADDDQEEHSHAYQQDAEAHRQVVSLVYVEETIDDYSKAETTGNAQGIRVLSPCKIQYVVRE